MVKKRRITKKDWDSVSKFILTEFEKRKSDRFRKHHEIIWKEIDRQISMEPMKFKNKNGSVMDPEWRSAIELGEMAKASEIITADVMRLTFPTTRAWFEAHLEMPNILDPQTGEKVKDPKLQEFGDKALRALMVQQHLDFGLKPRYELSVKEALHHGSYVSEIIFDTRMRVHDGTSVENLSAPVWKPYSMWNAYPDPSPSVLGTDMFYSGSMILVDYAPLYILKEMAKGDGWMPEQISRVQKRENENKDVKTEDIQLVKYYGDVEIKRQDGDIYLPNCKVILANDILVYYSPNELPFSPIIYSGYERMDVRDPYFTSPLIKLAPMHKIASQLANKYLDNVWMKVEPPVGYDALDPQFVKDGGPMIQPGAKIPLKGAGGFKEIQIGEPEQALLGLQFVIQQLQQGLGVNAIRSGAGNDVADKTATEISAAEAKAEIRTAEFVEKQERHALRPFLYMQHEYNLRKMGQYSFYNPEQDAEDFMTAVKSDLPKRVHFEIVGSKGVLGEQRRSQQMAEVTAFLLSNPKTEGLVNVTEIAKQMYQDAGVKNPERYLKEEENGNPEVEQVIQEAEQVISELEAKLQEAQNQMQLKAEESARKLDIEEFKAQRKAEIEEYKAEQKVMIDKFLAGMKANMESMKTSEKAINVLDSSTAQPLEGMAEAIRKMSEMVLSAVNSNNEQISNLAQNLTKEKSISVNRDESGRVTGATVN